MDFLRAVVGQGLLNHRRLLPAVAVEHLLQLVLPSLQGMHPCMELVDCAPKTPTWTSSMAVAMPQLAQLTSISISKVGRCREDQEAIEEEKHYEKNCASGEHEWPEVDGDSQVVVGVVELPRLLVRLGREKVPNRHLEKLMSASTSPQPTACIS